MTEGELALIVALAVGCTPEAAFIRLEQGTDFRLHPFTPEDIEDMRQMQMQGMSYREIGDCYFVSKYTVYGAIKGRIFRGKSKHSH